MKTMTCKQLGGACSKEFQADTFEEIAVMSKNHAMAMMEDPEHQEAMRKMKDLMKSGEFQEWYSAKKKEFENAPENS